MSPAAPDRPAVHTLAAMPNPLPPYILTRDTTCREGCPHYGYDAPAHSHFVQAEPPPRRQDGPVWRLLFRIWGDGQQ